MAPEAKIAETVATSSFVTAVVLGAGKVIWNTFKKTGGSPDKPVYTAPSIELMDKLDKILEANKANKALLTDSRERLDALTSSVDILTGSVDILASSLNALIPEIREGNKNSNLALEHLRFSGDD